MEAGWLILGWVVGIRIPGHRHGSASQRRCEPDVARQGTIVSCNVRPPWALGGNDELPMPNHTPFLLVLALCTSPAFGQETASPRFPDVLPAPLFEREDLPKLLGARMSERAIAGPPTSVDDELLRARADVTDTLLGHLLGVKSLVAMGRTPTFPDWSRAKISADKLSGCFKLPASSMAAGTLPPRRAALEEARRTLQARGTEAKSAEVRTMLQEYDAQVRALLARIDATDRDGAQALVLAYRDWVIALPDVAAVTATPDAVPVQDAAPAPAGPESAPAAVGEVAPRPLPVPDYAVDPVRLRLLKLQLRMEASLAPDADPLRRARLEAAIEFVNACADLRAHLPVWDARLAGLDREEGDLRVAGLDDQAKAVREQITDLRRRRTEAISARRLAERGNQRDALLLTVLLIDPAPALSEVTCRELGRLGQWLVAMANGPGDPSMQAECRKLAAGAGEVVRALRAGKAEDAVRHADALWAEVLAPVARLATRRSAPFPLPDVPPRDRQPTRLQTDSQVLRAMVGAADQFQRTVDDFVERRNKLREDLEDTKKRAVRDPRHAERLPDIERNIAALDTFTRLELAVALRGDGFTVFFADLAGGQPPALVAQKLATFRERLPKAVARSRSKVDRVHAERWIARAQEIEAALAGGDLEQAQRLLDAAWGEVTARR